ncbi:Glutamyl-tRNA(Gln) amidotransferase subunit A [bacterium YEK0313]|nr:Glutamyl-tRNA(Gln) amidotransferase subunit A [bacterium YEK0313]
MAQSMRISESNPNCPNAAAVPLHALELLELASLIARRDISPVTATDLTLDRIGTCDGQLASFVHVAAAAARADAAAAEREILAGSYRGPLHGIPIAVKDMFAVAGLATGAGMTIHAGREAVEDSTVVARLKAAGAIVIGTLQMTEGAYSDHHPAITPPKNPWAHDHWPGISSSGPAVAVAAGLSFGTIGSDTGGSIRWPSAANGLTGLKPSWGRVSRHGVFPLAPTLDHVGPIARSAADAAVLLAAIAGADPADPTCRHAPVPAPPPEPPRSLAGMRLGVDPAWNTAGVDPMVQQVLGDALAVFGSLGADVVDIAFPDVDEAVADWSPLCAVEAAVAHAEFYPSRARDYGPVLSGVVEAGLQVLGTALHAIRLRRRAFAGRVAALHGAVDLILTPVHPFPPLSLATIRSLGEQPALIAALQRYTCPFNMTGQPTLTLPGGFSADGLPLAFQLVGPDLGEAALIAAGMAFQAATDWHRRRPSPTMPPDRSRRQ